jgi:hypothetical protein
MFLGRIVTKSKIEGIPFFIEITESPGDFTIPTLIIGKKRAIDLFGVENIHVLDKKIQENVYWTFAKNERRVDYEEELKKFVNSIENKVNHSVNYYFINIFTEKLSFLKKFIKYIYNNERKSVYVTSKHIYIYGGKNVIGLSRGDFEYVGIDSDKVIKKIESNPSNIVFTDDEIDENIVKFAKSSNIIIPYIHYITY